MDRYQPRPTHQQSAPVTPSAAISQPRQPQATPSLQTVERPTQPTTRLQARPPVPTPAQQLRHTQLDTPTKLKKQRKKKLPRPKRNSKHPKLRRVIKVSLIALATATCLIVIIGGSYWYLTDKLAATADLRLGRKFTESLQAKNTDKAYSMTSKTFKDAATKEQLNQVIEKINIFYPKELELSTHWHDKPKVKDSTQSVIVYKSIVNDNDYYLRIILERSKPSAKWEILNLQSSNTELKANPDSIEDTKTIEEQPSN